MAQFDYDLVVIGGGSGGMATAKEAAKLGARVALFDYVKPSTQGTTWGLGGTCVNVGCVPKKLMHFAGLLGHGIKDAKSFGWSVGTASHSWDDLVETVSNHVRMLNFRYRVSLKSAAVTYFNALASFVDPHTLTYTLKGQQLSITSAFVVVACGGRPYIPADNEVPGARAYCITSDDVFTLSQAPNKTLCVGGSYIALETAGFLTELGFDVTVAVRSHVLRGFDRQCAEKVASLMNDFGTKFYYDTSPVSVTKLPNGKSSVILRSSSGDRVEQFDTVFFATGRRADTAGLGLDNAGVTYTMEGKIPVVNEQTNVPHIYAVGDAVEGVMELTPVAVQAGELLARRLFGGSQMLMDYTHVPTCVYTPVEYGCVGLSEEAAIQYYGADDIETYLFEFTTLEYQAAHRTKHPMHGEDEDLGPLCLSKLVCVKSLESRVVGFHFVGPNAGEITQGFALAVKLGAKKSDFDSLVGIHPTDAESFCAMSITRSSGKSWVAEGGCGGGVCG